MIHLRLLKILQKLGLTSKLRTNGFFGLMGFAIPTLVTLIAYPILVRHIGLAAMGVYILGSSVSGAMAMLDLGFSAATLKFVAEDVASGSLDDAAEVIVTSLVFYGGLGICGAAGLWFLAPFLMHTFQVDAVLLHDGIRSFRIAAAQFCFFMLVSVFLSIFKAFQHFHLSAMCLSALSVLTFGGGVMAVYAGAGLIGLTVVSMVSTGLVLLFAAALGLRHCGRSGINLWRAQPTTRTFRRMARFGSVLTANTASIIMLIQGQRYLAGVIFGPAAVTVYQLASMIPYKVQSAVGAICETLFPFASATAETARIRPVYLRMLAASGGLAIAALLPLVLLRHWLLPVWLGAESASPVAAVLPIFALAALANAMGSAPYYLAYGLGRPLLNSWYTGTALAINVLALVVLRISGHMTFAAFCWTLAIAQTISVLAFHAALEGFVWRRLLAARDAAPDVV